MYLHFLRRLKLSSLGFIPLQDILYTWQGQYMYTPLSIYSQNVVHTEETGYKCAYSQYLRLEEHNLFITLHIKSDAVAYRRYTLYYFKIFCHISTHIINNTEYQRVLKGLYRRTRLSRPSPSPLSKISLFLSLPVCRLLTGEGERVGGGAKSYDGEKA
jgi:hypothetical protein